MIAKVEQVGPTPYHQYSWYVVRIKIGTVVLEALNHYTFLDKEDAQKLADKVNKEISVYLEKSKEEDDLMTAIIKQEDESTQ